MDIKTLRYFVAVSETGSFSAASRRIRVAQPALSRQVRQLEAQLGVKLLTRSPNGVVTTEAGERLLRFGLGLVHQFDRVPTVVNAKDQPVSGAVSIGLPTSTGAVLSTPPLLRAKQLFPGIRIHLIESLTGYLEEWVMAGRLDLAVLYNAEPSSKLTLTPLMLEELHLVAAAAGPLAARRTMPFAELHRYPLIVPGSPHALRRLIDAAARSHGVELNIAYEVDSLPVLKTLVQSGEACAILSAGAVHRELADGTLRALKIVRPNVVRSVSLAASAVLDETPARVQLTKLVVELTAELQHSGAWPAVNQAASSKARTRVS
jgi:LysR family nitrogen assimilation transcriptional regulator